MLFALYLYPDILGQTSSCGVYDLIGKKVHETLVFPWTATNPISMHLLFRSVYEKYSAIVVKSFYVLQPLEIDSIYLLNWFSLMRMIAEKYGYTNLRRVYNWSENITGSLFNAKNNGINYSIGDKIVYLLVRPIHCDEMLAEMILLVKKEFGWRILNNSHRRFFKHYKQLFNNLFGQLDVEIREVKNILVGSVLPYSGIREVIKSSFPDDKLIWRYKDIAADHSIGQNELVDKNRQLIPQFSEYFAKVFSGEDYFTDYNWYVPSVSETKYELHVLNGLVQFPVQYRPVPWVIAAKFTIPENVSTIMFFVITVAEEMSYNQNQQFNISVSGVKNVVFTLYETINNEIEFKMESIDGEERKRVCGSVNCTTIAIPYPRLIICNGYCTGRFWFNGLPWKLKDADGCDKIPTAMRFGNRVYTVGKDALIDVMGENFDFEKLLDENFLKNEAEKNNRIEFDGQDYKIILPTTEGFIKMLITTLFNNFMKKIMESIETKTGEPILGFHFMMPTFKGGIHNSPIFKKAIKLLDIDFPENFN